MEAEYTLYEQQMARQLKRWEIRQQITPNFVERASKSVQTGINNLIPDKVHKTITATVKGIIQTTLFGINYIPAQEPLYDVSLADRDAKAEELLSLYKKIAAAEGAGAGAGGILLGLADFPILLGIKLKFLFELAHVYGYSTKDYRERLFILYVFQLAFSSPKKKTELLKTIKNWHVISDSFPPAAAYLDQVDWQQLQQEYRDTIDFRKMLQLIPGIGAVVGAWANFGLLEELGVAGMNCFRLRRLQDKVNTGSKEQ
ncbi:ABC transporter-associated protein EcsC [Paenibacillus ferrarius]|uniref:ABC transporter-associated protein EcsC n=1 Tax=Paenibacillus ferrarius TaxID=1469647 RepID=A0A1V4HNY8_9BACL|nr:EcsC family protein [Paenibacillus ferrarius]OPH59708.1 ABC transporter-associated protein EcsC [Paenibacillus ferrarius]